MGSCCAWMTAALPTPLHLWEGGDGQLTAHPGTLAPQTCPLALTHPLTLPPGCPAASGSTWRGGRAPGNDSSPRPPAIKGAHLSDHTVPDVLVGNNLALTGHASAAPHPHPLWEPTGPLNPFTKGLIKPNDRLQGDRDHTLEPQVGLTDSWRGRLHPFTSVTSPAWAGLFIAPL